MCILFPAYLQPVSSLRIYAEATDKVHVLVVDLASSVMGIYFRIVCLADRSPVLQSLLTGETGRRL